MEALSVIAGISRRIFRVVFILAALVSFVVNAYHYVDPTGAMAHVDYVGSTMLDVGGQRVYSSVWEEVDAGTAMLPFRKIEFERAYMACVNLKDGGGETLVANFLGKSGDKPIPVNVSLVGMK